MENYKEKYEQAFERARVWKEKSGMPVDKQGILDDIFPELKKSDDEKIRKTLKSFFDTEISDYGNVEWRNGIRYGEIVSWLEKQGEKSNISQDTEDDLRRQSTIQVLEYAKSLDAYNQYGKESINKDIAWLEKQAEQKPADKIQFGKNYKCIASPRYSTFMIGKIYKPEDKFLCSLMNFCSDCFEPIEEDEQNLTDKVEPKFKVGDTIVEKDLDEYDYETIKDIKNGQYIFTDGYCMNIDEQEGWQLVKTPTIIEQKPAWSEEDEQMINDIIEAIDEQYAVSDYQEMVNWLKSLKERVQAQSN